MHFTSRKPSVHFVQGEFLELLINSDLSFELNLEQKIPVNCLLEGRDVFSVMPTGFGKIFFQPCPPHHSDRTEEDLRKRVSEQCGSSYLPVEDQIKEGQPPGFTCASLQEVNDPFSDSPWSQLLTLCISIEGTR